MAAESESAAVKWVIDKCIRKIFTLNITDVPRIYALVEEEVELLKGDILRRRIKFPRTYQEPVQSPLSQASLTYIVVGTFRRLRVDYQPRPPAFQELRPLTKWLMNIYYGNYTKFMKMIENKTEEEVKKKLNMRETAIQVCAIFHVINGALAIASGTHIISFTDGPAFDGVDMEHMKILHKLLELGADVNAHDVAGYTPLHHCLEPNPAENQSEDNWQVQLANMLQSELGTNANAGNDAHQRYASIQLEMAKVLIDHGANVNERSRSGYTPLIMVRSTKNYACARLLVENGADPFIQDNDGYSMMVLDSLNLNMMKELLVANRDEILSEQREASEKYSYKKCTICKKESTKKCSGCQMEWYCSVQCQKQHWDSHVGVCNQRRSEYLPVDIHRFNNPTRKANFVVSIQLSTGMHMRIYTQDLSLECCIDPHSGAGRVFFKIVKEDGFRGFKGFFNARKENNKILVHPKILPPMMW